jgi:2-hydroxycyclohexanecarboxyl-CoA dehydrogenase
MRGLNNRNIIVTGGGSGIGRAVCQRLAEEGANVGVFDINAEGAQETVELIAGAGRNTGVFMLDISDYAQCERSVADFESQIGPTDALVNCVGWDKVVPFLETEPEMWRKIVDINLYGPVNMCRVVLPGMVERGGGRVVSLSSDAGRVGSTGEAVYAACKGGIIAFTKSIARELARKGVILNVVSPGPTDTPLYKETQTDANPKMSEALIRAIPMRRLGQPEDHAGMVSLLCSDEASYITGQVISISGGLTMHG